MALAKMGNGIMDLRDAVKEKRKEIHHSLHFMTFRAKIS